jgi:two-component system, NarL family, invasion response regulator UvrY
VLDALHEPDGALRPPHAGLSRRQLQVLQLLASGLTPTGIAARLQVSVKTVSSHRQRILEKMRMSSTAELMRYAIERQLTAADWPAAAVIRG